MYKRVRFPPEKSNMRFGSIFDSTTVIAGVPNHSLKIYQLSAELLLPENESADGATSSDRNMPPDCVNNVKTTEIRFSSMRFLSKSKGNNIIYGVAHRELIPETRYSTENYANNRAELSHRPTRVRERGMRELSSMKQSQGFLNTHAAAYNMLNLGRQLVSAETYRQVGLCSFASWKNAAMI